MNEQSVVDHGRDGGHADQRRVLSVHRLQFHSGSESRRSHRLERKKNPQNVTNVHRCRSNCHRLTVIKTRDASTYCVEALEQMFWSKLTSAVLYIHAPVELPVLAAYETHTQSAQLLSTVDRSDRRMLVEAHL